MSGRSKIVQKRLGIIARVQLLGKMAKSGHLFEKMNASRRCPLSAYWSLLEISSRMPLTRLQKISVHTPNSTVLGFVPL